MAAGPVLGSANLGLGSNDSAPAAGVGSEDWRLPIWYGTNVTLQLVGVISNATGFVPTAWSQQGGPGSVTFGDTNALATTARFSAIGIYQLKFAAVATSASATQSVVVASAFSSTNGLQAWWKMDETGSPALLADASGNNRNATNTSGAMTTGFISNAVQFTSTTARATWPAANSNQVTVAAWVRCDTTGGGTFPRIVDTPAYRVIFRFSSSDVNSVGFASFDTVNGDWDSGAGSISLGTWYHVAVTHDRTTLTTPPVFYINGVKRATATLASPSGTAPSLGGTGYIGNNAALSRNWNGLMDDLRIYNRVLTANEVAVLAASPPTNLPPTVFAGVNQTNHWPAPMNLVGTASDDGKPYGTLATTWSAVSGPGAVTFGNANASATTASFPSGGDYVLRLRADDGQVQTVSDVFVTAIARPTLAIQPLPGAVKLSWQIAGGTWRLQSQTNSLAVGLGTNWVDVADANATNEINVATSPATGSVFYRLISR